MFVFLADYGDADVSSSEISEMSTKLVDLRYEEDLDGDGYADDSLTEAESNAVIDAVNAVNLMTVHAAKGLEFPIVFVVDMTRGTAPRRDPIRVTIGHGDANLPTVSVGNFPSDTDQDTTDQEREETKRLLYVAVTRARDRLYLASVVKDGHMPLE